MRFKSSQGYLGGLCGGREEMEEWLLPKVTKWADMINTLGMFAVRYPQRVYVGIAMSLQAE